MLKEVPLQQRRDRKTLFAVKALSVLVAASTVKVKGRNSPAKFAKNSSALFFGRARSDTLERAPFLLHSLCTESSLLMHLYRYRFVPITLFTTNFV